MTFIVVGDVAVPCECRDIRIAEDILKQSGISEEFRKKTFDNFNYSYDIQVIDAYSKATRYYSDFSNIRDTRRNSFLALGQVGSGKTHLSLAIANKLMDDGIGVVYMGYRDVIMRFKQNVMNEEEYNKLMNRYKRAKVLLIDDLFKGKITDSDINIMFELINHRYFNNLPMIVSSEFNVGRLLEVDEALGSRLIEMSKGRVVELRGRELNYRMYG